MPRLVPARWLAELRPDATQGVEPSGLAPDSRRRVRVAAAIGAMAYAVFLAAALSPLQHATSLERSIDLAHDLFGLGLGLALWWVARTRSISDRAVLRLALVAQVLLASVISVAVPWAGYIRTAHLTSLTWVVPLIILFPLLVPTPPRTALLVSSLCALAMPAGLLLLSANGLITLGTTPLLRSCLTAAVTVAIASIAARTVYVARQQAAAARTVGSYELLERIGQGGMGEVWVARHLLLRRPAAVKLILPAALQGPLEAREEMLKRFGEEAQGLASLCSPHTVKLFDFGSASDDALYYAMEMLDGITVERLVFEFGALEPRRAVHWLRQVCHSLGEAHALPVPLIHRDIKPANLFVCRYGREVDFIKLLDFGLSRPTTRDGNEALTRRGVILGTPGYMAPEQVYGLDVDARTDLYALGCVGYFLLAGRRPFESMNLGELLQQHVEVAPPPLSSVAPHPIAPRLERVIMDCLAKKPSDRPASADALDDALRTALDGEAWSQRDARAWWAAHPVSR